VVGPPHDAGVDERYERFRSAWDELSEQAHHGALLGGGFDGPLANLVDASQGTVLRRFYPFTSMARLCFACSRYPFERVQPTCVQFNRDGIFQVLDGGPYPPTSNPAIALETDDPRAAIDEAIHRLVGC
jgi:Family of unknown function (DUF6193)